LPLTLTLSQRERRILPPHIQERECGFPLSPRERAERAAASEGEGLPDAAVILSFGAPPRSPYIADFLCEDAPFFV